MDRSGSINGAGGPAATHSLEDSQDPVGGMGAVPGQSYTPPPGESQPPKKSLKERHVNTTNPTVSVEGGEPQSHFKREAFEDLNDDMRQEWESSQSSSQQVPGKHKSPFKKKNYWFGGFASAGGLALALGCSAIPFVGPVLLGLGASIYVMGLMAHTYAYFQEDDPSMANNMADKRDRDKKDNDPVRGSGENSHVDGKEKPAPVDYSGKDQVQPPPQPPSAIPPQGMHPGMIPPGMGMPPVMGMPPGMGMSPGMGMPGFVDFGGLMGGIQGYFQQGGSPFGPQAVDKAMELAQRYIVPPKPSEPTSWPEALDKVQELIKSQPAPAPVNITIQDVGKVTGSGNSRNDNKAINNDKSTAEVDHPVVLTSKVRGMIKDAAGDDEHGEELVRIIDNVQAVDTEEYDDTPMEESEPHIIPPPPDFADSSETSENKESSPPPVKPKPSQVKRPDLGLSAGLGRDLKRVNVANLPVYDGENSDGDLTNPYEPAMTSRLKDNQSLSLARNAMRRELKFRAITEGSKDDFYSANGKGDYFDRSCVNYFEHLIDRVLDKSEDIEQLTVDDLLNQMVSEIEDPSKSYPGEHKGLQRMYKHWVAFLGCRKEVNPAGWEKASSQNWYQAGESDELIQNDSLNAQTLEGIKKTQGNEKATATEKSLAKEKDEKRVFVIRPPSAFLLRVGDN